jgi:hypothetical protein
LENPFIDKEDIPRRLDASLKDDMVLATVEVGSLAGGLMVE